MNCAEEPIYLWFYDFLYLVGLINVSSDNSIGYLSPEDKCNGVSTDI